MSKEGLETLRELRTIPFSHCGVRKTWARSGDGVAWCSLFRIMLLMAAGEHNVSGHRNTERVLIQLGSIS